MSSQSVPDYVDTKTKALAWHGYNFVILLANLVILVPAGFVLEYEIAKLTHVGVMFLKTPVIFDLIACGLIVGLALFNLSILLFVYLRHLWRRKWMIWTTSLAWMLLAVMALVLQYRIITILFP